MHLRLPQPPSPRARPAFRAWAWCARRSRRARAGRWPIIWRRWASGRWRVLGVIGQDGFGLELSHALAARGVSLELCVRTPAMQTFTYTKVINARYRHRRPAPPGFHQHRAARPRCGTPDSRQSATGRRVVRRHPDCRPGRDQPGRRGHARRARPARRACAAISRSHLLCRLARAHSPVPRRHRQTQSARRPRAPAGNCSAGWISPPCSATRNRR